MALLFEGSLRLPAFAAARVGALKGAAGEGFRVTEEC
jgi:hypothetical protein